MPSKWFESLKQDFVQGFPAFCGFEVIRADFGTFETCLKVLDNHRQQDGFVHAGVIATMADHTAASPSTSVWNRAAAKDTKKNAAHMALSTGGS